MVRASTAESSSMAFAGRVKAWRKTRGLFPSTAAPCGPVAFNRRVTSGKPRTGCQREGFDMAALHQPNLREGRLPQNRLRVIRRTLLLYPSELQGHGVLATLPDVTLDHPRRQRLRPAAKPGWWTAALLKRYLKLPLRTGRRRSDWPGQWFRPRSDREVMFSALPMSGHRNSPPAVRGPGLSILTGLPDSRSWRLSAGRQ